MGATGDADQREGDGEVVAVLVEDALEAAVALRERDATWEVAAANAPARELVGRDVDPVTLERALRERGLSFEVVAEAARARRTRRASAPSGEWTAEAVPLAGLVVLRICRRDDAFYRMLATDTADVLSLADTDAVLRWVSPAVTEVLGYRPEEMVGRSLLDFVVDPDDLTVRGVQRRLPSGELVVYQVDLRTKDGGARSLQISVREVSDPRDGARVRVASWRDLAGEREARARLAVSEDRFRLVAENASDVVLELDATGVVRWASPSATRLTGTEGAVVGTRLWSHVATSDRVAAQVWWRRAQSQGSAVERLRLLSTGGGPRWYEARASTVATAGGTVVVALRDVQSEVVAQRAHATLSLATRILLDADDEETLLAEICNCLVDAGGYALAWYARPVEDAAGSLERVAVNRHPVGYLDEIRPSWRAGANGTGLIGTVLLQGATVVLDDAVAIDSANPWRLVAKRYGIGSVISLPVEVNGRIDGALTVYAVETEAFGPEVRSLLTLLVDEVGDGIARLRERAVLAETRAEVSAFEVVTNLARAAVAIFDLDGAVTYANAAAGQAVGLEAEDLLGRDRTWFRDRFVDAEFLEEVLVAIGEHRPWSGSVPFHRADGFTVRTEISVNPVIDYDGTLLYVVVIMTAPALDAASLDGLSLEGPAAPSR